MIRKILLGTILAILVATPVSAAPEPDPNFESYVRLREDPATLNYGETVSFDVQFPRMAARKARHPQFEEAPIIQINCYPWATGTWDYLAQTWTYDGWRITDGWQGYTWSRPLNRNWPKDSRKWESGGANCSAIMFNADIVNGDLKFYIWASTRFTVQP